MPIYLLSEYANLFILLLQWTEYQFQFFFDQLKNLNLFRYCYDLQGFVHQ